MRPQAYETAKNLPWLNVSRPLTSEDLLGKVVLIDFWTYCCINCMHILPDLKKLEHEFKDDLVVIGSHSAKFENEKNSENIREAILRYEIEHPVINDKDFILWRMFDVHAWPSFVLLDTRGMYRGSTSGEGQYEVLRENIQKLIAEAKENGTLKNNKIPVRLETKSQTDLLFPAKIAFDPRSEKFWISDSNHHRLIRFDKKGEVDFVVGSGEAGQKGGDFNQAEFFQPQGVIVDEDFVYVADTSNHLIRRVDTKNKKVETIAGTGKQGYERAPKNIAKETPIASPWDLAITPIAGKKVLVIAMAGTHQIWGLPLTSDPSKEKFLVLAGSGREDIDDGDFKSASLAQTSGLAVDANKIYFADSETSSIRVLEKQNVKTIVGAGLFEFGLIDGLTQAARFQHPLGLAVSENKIYVADTYNSAIREINLKTNQVSTLLKTGLREPNDVLVLGDDLWIVDTNHHSIKKFNLKTKELSELKIKVPQNLNNTTSKENSLLAELPFLPNLVELPKVQGGLEKSNSQSIHISVAIELPKGKKINAEAPSSWQLYELIENKKTPLYNRLANQKISTSHFDISAKMDTSHSAHKLFADFSFYYCGEGETALSQCEIKSFRQSIDLTNQPLKLLIKI
ncbi:MAG: hypothetical protein J0L93_00745 [Deltaproteobacteria bacterium]|nr:hypothetical protein [Deltaproteobacteria bacterium]